MTVEQDCSACICEGVLKTVANSNADLDMAHKNSKSKVVCAGEKDLDDQKHQKRQSSVFVRKSCSAQRNRYKEQIWKP